MEGYGSSLPTSDLEEPGLEGYGSSLPEPERKLEETDVSLSPSEAERRRQEPPRLSPRRVPAMPGPLRKSNTGEVTRRERAGLTESSPLIQLPVRRGPGGAGGKTRKASVGEFDAKDETGRVAKPKTSKSKLKTSRNRQFLSLTREQVEKANALASGLRNRDHTLHDINASLEMEGLSLPEKLLLLRNRVGPAPAADLMQQLLIETASVGGSKDEIAARVDAGISAKLQAFAEAKEEAGQREWNEEFQTLLEMEDGVDKFALLRALYSDFCYAAQSYGSIIISERHLPVEMKTIRPSTSLGGVAGGEKYVCQNILFKFAVDQKVNGTWMYGNDQPSDEAAMKAASNELMGLVHVFKCEVKGLHLPLSALIDSKGYRLAAFAVLPVDKTTLVYGSDDGGKTVHNKTVSCSTKMRQLASSLNLMEHSVHGTKISLASDVEAHRGKDGRLYMLDFARVFPPEAPREGDNPRGIFHRLLRPELVKRSPVPLSSDAFSLFQRSDPKDRALNGQVTVATEMLHQEIIPQVGLFLSEVQSVNNLMLIGTIHRAGINVRHLGRLRQHVDRKAVKMRQILLSEMCARIIKVLIRAAMRERMKEYQLPSVEPFFAVLVDVLNLCFVRSFESAILWRNRTGNVPNPPSVSSMLKIATMKQALEAKFQGALDPDEELIDSVDLRDCISVRYVIERLQVMACFKLASTAAELFSVDGKAMVGISHNDVLNIDSKLKYLPIIDYYTGIQLALAAMSAKHREDQKRLANMAEERFMRTLTSLPDHAPTFFQWGRLLHSQASRASSLEGYAAAMTKFRQAVDLDPLQREFIGGLAGMMQDFGQCLMKRALADKSKTFLRQAMEKFREAVKLTPGTAVRFILDFAESLSPRLQNDFDFEACNQLLDCIAKKSPEAAKRQDEMLLDWAVNLTGDIAFQNASVDSLCCLHAAEKVNLLGRESFELYLTRIDSSNDVMNLLRLSAVAKFAPHLQQRVALNCELLTSISLKNLSGLTSALLRDLWDMCPNLTSIRLVRCNVDDESMVHLTEKLAGRPVTELMLPGCIYLQSTFLPAVAKNIGDTLRILNLALCFVSDEACKDLSRNCPNLERLSVSKTRVSSDSLIPLIKAARNLQVLDIGGCGNVTDKLFPALIGCSNLQTLIVCASAQLTNKALSNIVKIPRLSLLDVSHCDKIDEKGLVALLRSETLSEVYLKGAQGRLEERIQRKLVQTFTCFFATTLAEKLLSKLGVSGSISNVGTSPAGSPRAAAAPEMQLIDLSCDELIVFPRKIRSPREDRSLRQSGIKSMAVPTTPRGQQQQQQQQSQQPREQGVGEEDTSQPPTIGEEGRRKSLARLSTLRKNLSRRSSSHVVEKRRSSFEDGSGSLLESPRK